MEGHAADYDPVHYWQTSHATSFAVIAAIQQSTFRNEASVGQVDTSDLVQNESISKHPHDGCASCHQLTETVAAFLQRLRPSTAKASDVGPWIFIANRAFKNTSKRDLRRMLDVGVGLLEDFEEDLEEIREGNTGRSNASKSALTRKINTKRRKLETDILQLASDTGIVTGKWMLFPSADNLDDTWAAVAGATAKGTLGIEAKVATASDDGASSRGRLICVYTKDFRDKEDLRRVLVRLIEIGVVSKGGGPTARPIYYKCDAYTHLDVSTGNQWGMKPSMYSSTEILASKP